MEALITFIVGAYYFHLWLKLNKHFAKGANKTSATVGIQEGQYVETFLVKVIDYILVILTAKRKTPVPVSFRK